MRLTAVIEYGIRFETGVPVCFTSVRNTERAPYLGVQFQQDIEPAGLYMIHNPDPSALPRGWVRRRVCFDKPLVLAFNERDNVTYDAYSWKVALVRAFRVAGRGLSIALVKQGYDGVVTTLEDNETREIIQLR